MLIRSNAGHLSSTIKDFKSFTAKKILEELHSSTESRKEWILNLFEFTAKQHKRNENYQVWTHENHAEIIYRNSFLEQKMRYIHENPVRAGIVEQAEDYLYSSARNYVCLTSLLEIDALF